MNIGDMVIVHDACVFVAHINKMHELPKYDFLNL